MAFNDTPPDTMLCELCDGTSRRQTGLGTWQGLPGGNWTALYICSDCGHQMERSGQLHRLHVHREGTEAGEPS